MLDKSVSPISDPSPSEETSNIVTPLREESGKSKSLSSGSQISNSDEEELDDLDHGKDQESRPNINTSASPSPSPSVSIKKEESAKLNTTPPNDVDDNVDDYESKSTGIKSEEESSTTASATTSTNTTTGKSSTSVITTSATSGNFDATKWSKEMNNLFVELLIRESSENYYEKNENDWSRDSWARITRELELAFPLKAKVNKFDRTKLKKHLKILKDEHAYWRFIKDNAKGFKWDNSKGCFSLGYHDVEHYFAVNKYVENPLVVKEYLRKKSWLKKFCAPHACDYIVKYNRYLYSDSKQYHSGVDEHDVSVEEDEDEDQDEGLIDARELELERKRKIFDDDTDDDEKANKDDGDEDNANDDNDNDNTKVETAKEDKVHHHFMREVPNSKTAESPANSSNDEDDEDINEDENELLELTGYGKKSRSQETRPVSTPNKNSKISKQLKQNNNKRQKITNGNLSSNQAHWTPKSYIFDHLYHLNSSSGKVSSTEDNNGERATNNDNRQQNILNLNLQTFNRISSFVMRNVLQKKILPRAQLILSQLLLTDLVLFSFLSNESGEFSDEQKIWYINQVTKEYEA